MFRSLPVPCTSHACLRGRLLAEKDTMHSNQVSNDAHGDTNLNVEKTPTIISDIARLTSRKFMVVLMFLSLRTTRQTSEFPSKFTATMTEHSEITALLTMLTACTVTDAKRKLSCRRETK